MGFFKPFTTRKIHERMDEIIKKWDAASAEDRKFLIDPDAPVDVFFKDDNFDKFDDGDTRQIISIGGNDDRPGMGLTLFDRYGD